MRPGTCDLTHTLAGMAYIRNLSKRPVAFDLPALGTQAHRGGVNALDPVSGKRGFKPHVRLLPKSLSLAACTNPRATLAQAIADGSAVDRLPDTVLDADEVKKRVARKELRAGAEVAS